MFYQALQYVNVLCHYCSHRNRKFSNSTNTKRFNTQNLCILLYIVKSSDWQSQDNHSTQCLKHFTYCGNFKPCKTRINWNVPRWWFTCIYIPLIDLNLIDIIHLNCYNMMKPSPSLTSNKLYFKRFARDFTNSITQIIFGILGCTSNQNNCM
jgi:hypothetical protein